MFLNLDFDEYVPVQHSSTQAYFAFRARENKDFDAASETDLYRCYPLQANGQINKKIKCFFPKKELQAILLLL